jgi:plasmid stabilization system protein ParE
MGRVYDERRRRYVYRSHHVYYRIRKDKILIVDIRNTRQAPQSGG